MIERAKAEPSAFPGPQMAASRRSLPAQALQWSGLFIRICISLAGLGLILSGIHHIESSLLDRNTSATVIGIQRRSGDSRDDLNYLIGYQFMTDQHKAAGGTYVLENPTHLGDVPRMGSYLTVSYSSFNPAVNEPWSNQTIDMDEVFQAAFLCIIGIVFWAGAIFLH